MRGLLLLVLSGLLTTSAFADWQQELSPSQPGTFAPLRPLHAHYKFGWSFFSAAEATFDYTKAKGQMRMQVAAKSIGMVRSMWRMDTLHVALMQPGTLRPINVRQTETYRDRTIKTKLDFDSTGVTRLRESDPGDGKPPKPKRYDYPNLFDLNSALHWIRSQRLANGDTYKLVVYPATAAYLAEVNVLDRQKISAAGRTWNAIRVSLKLWKINDKMELEPHRKFKNATVWVSDDTDRMLLKINTDIFVGSVWAEMDQLEFSK